mmetsp:Transcript_98176/g.211788  ORF Transcript_98176/g.211788 Transcript_98176/m.211788 type:complete len:233 (-) Transcript_98176:222-920(-)
MVVRRNRAGSPLPHLLVADSQGSVEVKAVAVPPGVPYQVLGMPTNRDCVAPSATHAEIIPFICHSILPRVDGVDGQLAGWAVLGQLCEDRVANYSPPSSPGLRLAVRRKGGARRLVAWSGRGYAGPWRLSCLVCLGCLRCLACLGCFGCLGCLRCPGFLVCLGCLRCLGCLGCFGGLGCLRCHEFDPARPQLLLVECAVILPPLRDHGECHEDAECETYDARTFGKTRTQTL